MWSPSNNISLKNITRMTYNIENFSWTAFLLNKPGKKSMKKEVKLL